MSFIWSAVINLQLIQVSLQVEVLQQPFYKCDFPKAIILDYDTYLGGVLPAASRVNKDMLNLE